MSVFIGQEIPRQGGYFRGVQDHFGQLQMLWQDRYAPRYGFLRPYVTYMIYRYTECCDLHFGFARVKCQDCGHDYLLAFSCKHCRFCPSCHQNRVLEFGECLCTQVLKFEKYHTREELFSHPSDTVFAQKTELPVGVIAGKLFLRRPLEHRPGVLTCSQPHVCSYALVIISYLRRLPCAMRRNPLGRLVRPFPHDRISACNVDRMWISRYR